MDWDFRYDNYAILEGPGAGPLVARGEGPVSINKIVMMIKHMDLQIQKNQKRINEWSCMHGM